MHHVPEKSLAEFEIRVNRRPQRNAALFQDDKIREAPLICIPAHSIALNETNHHG